MFLSSLHKAATWIPLKVWTKVRYARTSNVEELEKFKAEQPGIAQETCVRLGENYKWLHGVSSQKGPNYEHKGG